MHLLLIHQAFVTTGEAGGTRHIELARWLIRRGYRLTVITSPVSYLTGEAKRGTDTPREETVDGIRILYASTSSGLHRGFVQRLFAFFSFMFSSYRLALSVADVDVVWGTSPNLFQALSAWASARRKRIPFLLEIRDLWPDFAIGMGVLKNPLLIWGARFLERFLYRKADRIIVNSPGFIPHVQRLSGKTPGLVPNAADVEMFTADESADLIGAASWRKGNEFIVMYTGAHGPANDLDTALAAARILSDRETAIRFVFVGSGKEKARLIALSEALKLENVTFLPPVSKAEIKNLIAAADAGLAILKAIPEFTTTYPNKVFDFMAAGKPVLCQIDGVIREVVERYDAGIFVPPGRAEALADAASELAADRERGRRMGRNGREAIRNDFSREKTAAKFEAELDALSADLRG